MEATANNSLGRRSTGLYGRLVLLLLCLQVGV
jgi:hypothetical protein